MPNNLYVNTIVITSPLKHELPFVHIYEASNSPSDLISKKDTTSPGFLDELVTNVMEELSRENPDPDVWLPAISLYTSLILFEDGYAQETFTSVGGEKTDKLLKTMVYRMVSPGFMQAMLNLLGSDHGMASDTLELMKQMAHIRSLTGDDALITDALDTMEDNINSIIRKSVEGFMDQIVGFIEDHIRREVNARLASLPTSQPPSSAPTTAVSYSSNP